MKSEFYMELDLNTDSISGRKIIAAKPQEAESEEEMVEIINQNSGLMWMVKIRPDIQTVKVCCEEIIKRDEKGSLALKLAKAILKMIKEPRNAAERKPRQRRAR